MRKEVFFRESRLGMGTVLFTLFSYILFNIFVAFVIVPNTVILAKDGSSIFNRRRRELGGCICLL